MIKHYILTLTFYGYAHIGCGREITKKEYYYNSKGHTILVLNPENLFRCLIQNEWVGDYEKFVKDADANLADFFAQHPIRGMKKGYLPKEMIAYKLSAPVDWSTRRNITPFIRTASAEPYIPGSSVKGMLRTALTYYFLKQNRAVLPPPNAQAELEDTKKALFDAEVKLFHTLRFSDDPESITNTVFRGLSISDSAPLAQNEVSLCTRLDYRPSNSKSSENPRQLKVVCRECIGGSVRTPLSVKFHLSLDTELAGPITAELLKQAVCCFDEDYHNLVRVHYDAPFPKSEIGTQPFLFLGGGAGYQSKTVTNGWMDNETAMNYAIKVLSSTKQLQAHHHEADLNKGISPRMLKYYQCGDAKLPAGLCTMSINEGKI